MPIENSESVQRGVRVKKAHDEHLQRKAAANSDNKHNNVATEINLLIEADYKKAGSPKFKKRK